MGARGHWRPTRAQRHRQCESGHSGTPFLLSIRHWSSPQPSLTPASSTILVLRLHCHHFHWRSLVHILPVSPHLHFCCSASFNFRSNCCCNCVCRSSAGRLWSLDLHLALHRPQMLCTPHRHCSGRFNFVFLCNFLRPEGKGPFNLCENFPSPDFCGVLGGVTRGGELGGGRLNRAIAV